MLLGIPTTSSVTQGAGVSISTPYYALYGADTWRATPKLTVNAGLRFEYEFGPHS
jgi:outer membrane receptor protein involved in Fe transport